MSHNLYDKTCIINGTKVKVGVFISPSHAPHTESYWDRSQHFHLWESKPHRGVSLQLDAKPANSARPPRT